MPPCNVLSPPSRVWGIVSFYGHPYKPGVLYMFPLVPLCLTIPCGLVPLYSSLKGKFALPTPLHDPFHPAGFSHRQGGFLSAEQIPRPPVLNVNIRLRRRVYRAFDT